MLKRFVLIPVVLVMMAVFMFAALSGCSAPVSSNQCAPWFDAPSWVTAGGSVPLSATINTTEPYIFGWHATGGSFDNALAHYTVWHAPTTPGTYYLEAQATYGQGDGASKKLSLMRIIDVVN